MGNNGFVLYNYSSRAYTDEETICFSNATSGHFADIEKEMQRHKNVKNVEVCSLTQKEFDVFVNEYADQYESLYFFYQPKVKDMSALASLRNVKYLLFWSCRAGQLWDMKNNISLRGLLLWQCKNMVYDVFPIAGAPNLEELSILSTGPGSSAKHTVKTLEPVMASHSLKRVCLECNTENRNFDPTEFSHLEVFNYRVDRKRNY